MTAKGTVPVGRTICVRTMRLECILGIWKSLEGWCFWNKRSEHKIKTTGHWEVQRNTMKAV